MTYRKRDGLIIVAGIVVAFLFGTVCGMRHYHRDVVFAVYESGQAYTNASVTSVTYMIGQRR